MQARERSGPSGLHVAGQSPTSPKGWETMRLALIEGNVSTTCHQRASTVTLDAFSADGQSLPYLQSVSASMVVQFSMPVQRLIIPHFCMRSHCSTTCAGTKLHGHVMLLGSAVRQVKMVSPQEVQFASDRGALVVDVRPEADYDAVSRDGDMFCCLLTVAGKFVSRTSSNWLSAVAGRIVCRGSNSRQSCSSSPPW